MPDLAEKGPLIEQYAAGAEVLAGEAAFARAGVRLLGQLTQDPSDEVILPLAIDTATGSESLATSALDIMPVIQRAVEPLTPKQTDPAHAQNVRWTQDWRAVKRELMERAKTRPAIGETIRDWFLDEGSDMVETRFASAESHSPLYVVVGGANEQCNDRSVQVLASMASSEFKQEHGLMTLSEHGLNGENERPAGWLRDEQFTDVLRDHVAQRIADGEVDPQVLVAGSASSRRVLNETELGKTSICLAEGTEPLYPERGLTEADAMLAGAMKVFGGDRESLMVQEIEPAEAGEVPTKLIRFQTALGVPVTFIASAGSEANLLSQTLKAAEYAPELFEARDGIYGTTTAIYSAIHRAILREVAAVRGMSGVPVDALGAGAHAAGITRKPETLIGELTSYLNAIYDIAFRMLENAELNTKLDLRLRVGGAAVHGASS